MPGCCAVPLPSSVSPALYRVFFFSKDVRDCVCLSTSRGTVGENSSIVAVKDAIEEVLGRCFVNFGLCRIVIKDSVEGKGLVLGPLSTHSRSQASGLLVLGVKDPEQGVSLLQKHNWPRAYKHFSSMTLMTDRIPLPA